MVNRNTFVKPEDLSSEADVEVLVVEKLIRLLGHPDNRSLMLRTLKSGRA